MLSFFSFIFYVLVIFSPLIILIGLINLKCIVLDDRVLVKFYGMKLRDIHFNHIVNISKVNQFNSLFKDRDILFNKSIKIEIDKNKLSNKDYLIKLFGSKYFIFSPKNSDIIFDQLTSKYTEYING